jgi:hypothetical protein
VGLKDVTTGDTLCDPDAVITLERMEFPEPVISLAIEPKTKADQEMGIACSAWRRKIRRSVCTLTKSPGRPLFPGWASYIWKLSSTV